MPGVHAHLSLVLLLSVAARGMCLPMEQARQHVGEVKCVAGKVIRVKQGERGVHFLDFCDDYRLCPFTVVVFPGDLKSVGDIRQLEGRLIEIHGPVQEYDGRAEIILREFRQLSGAGAKIPPLPKTYDVENKGRYRAGTFRHPKSKQRNPRKRQPPNLVTQEPEETQCPGSGLFLQSVKTCLLHHSLPQLAQRIKRPPPHHSTSPQSEASRTYHGIDE